MRLARLFSKVKQFLFLLHDLYAPILTNLASFERPAQKTKRKASVAEEVAEEVFVATPRL